MPRRDGYGVLEELVKHPHAATIPVIVSSSLALSEADRSRLSHAFAVVSKANLSAELIGALLVDALGRRR
jgi:CheY-like chemotaxis protein